MADLMQQARELLAETLDAIADDTRYHALNGEQHDHLREAAAALRAAPEVETLSESDKEVAMAQAVELAQYVEKNAKGGLREAAARFLSLSYAQDVAQRLRGAPTGTDEYLAYLEAAVDEAGFVIKHDGGSLGNSNFRIEPKVPASPSIPLKVFSEGPWVFGETGQQFSGADLDGAAFAAYQQCNAPCAAPEGFVLVPVEPTQEMLDMVCTADGFEPWTDKTMGDVYRTMLAARPQGVKDAT